MEWRARRSPCELLRRQGSVCVILFACWKPRSANKISAKARTPAPSRRKGSGEIRPGEASRVQSVLRASEIVPALGSRRLARTHSRERLGVAVQSAALNQRCLSDDLDLSRRDPFLHGRPFRCLALRGQPRRPVHQGRAHRHAGGSRFRGRCRPACHLYPDCGTHRRRVCLRRCRRFPQNGPPPRRSIVRKAGPLRDYPVKA